MGCQERPRRSTFEQTIEDRSGTLNLGIAIIGLSLFTVAFVLAARASRRVLYLRVSGGRIVRARGRAPAELLHDIEDITASVRWSGTIEILSEGDRAVVQTNDGTDAAVSQRFRNVVGRFTLARLRGAPVVEDSRER